MCYHHNYLKEAKSVIQALSLKMILQLLRCCGAQRHLVVCLWNCDQSLTTCRPRTSQKGNNILSKDEDTVCIE